MSPDTSSICGRCNVRPRIQPFKLCAQCRAPQQVRNNNTRCRNAGVPGVLSVEEWLRMCEAVGWNCPKCKSRGDLVIDHIHPLSRGGSNDPANIQPLCDSCNASKKNGWCNSLPYDKSVHASLTTVQRLAFDRHMAQTGIGMSECVRESLFQTIDHWPCDTTTEEEWRAAASKSQADIDTLHEQAMDLTDQAHRLRRRGSCDEARHIFVQALELELQVINAYPVGETNSPAYPILLRSAATIAFYAAKYRDGEKLIGEALACDIPDDVAGELRGLYWRVVHALSELQGIANAG